MNQKRKEVIKRNEISELRTYTLGGYPQKVLIEGRRRSNPIVIYLHGGPGASLPISVGGRGMFPELTEQVTMLYWDQLGCGINVYPIDESFCVEHFVKMLVDLIRQVKADFPNNQINLFAMSWGSILAAKAADEVPELIHRVLVYGQILKNLMINEEVFTSLRNSSLPKRQKEKLGEIEQSPVHSLNHMNIVARWVSKYTEGYRSKTGGNVKMGNVIGGVLTSPDYTFKNAIATVINSYLKNKSLRIELMQIDLTSELRRVKVPYLMLQGDKDIVTSTKMLLDFTQASKNENIICEVVPDSAHAFSVSGWKTILERGFTFLKSQ